MKRRVLVLPLGGALIALAVVLTLRIRSAVALLAGFLLAGAAVAWPMRKARGFVGSEEGNGPQEKPESAVG